MNFDSRIDVLTLHYIAPRPELHIIMRAPELPQVLDLSFVCYNEMQQTDRIQQTLISLSYGYRTIQHQGIATVSIWLWVTYCLMQRKLNPAPSYGIEMWKANVLLTTLTRSLIPSIRALLSGHNHLLKVPYPQCHHILWVSIKIRMLE